MTVSPLVALEHLERLYKHGFRDAVTDTALVRLVTSQVARDEVALRDLERDLSELEHQYGMSTQDFVEQWQSGRMDDSADFMDWNALHKMAEQVRARLDLLRSEPEPESA